ncbi:MAG: Gfo/Idh/MocA family protein [Bacillota bacterium]
MGKKIKWGIMGCGKIAHSFAEDLKVLPDAELYAVASKTPGKAEGFAGTYGIQEFYQNYVELVNNPNIDVVYIATTNNLHYDNALLCLNHGKHVLCEKPFTINADQANSLVKAAREKKLFLMEAMWTRFFPCIVELNRILEEKQIGDVKMLRADFGISREPDPTDRKINPDLGGGALLDLGIYPISFASMIFKRPPSKIISSAFLGKTGVDEQSSYVFEYDNGKMALMFSSFLSDTPHEALISGTKGYIRIPDFFHPSRMFVNINGQERVIEKKHESKGYNFEAQEVMNCILSGRVESDIIPLDETVAIIKVLDELRSQWGIRYPEESSS